MITLLTDHNHSVSRKYRKIAIEGQIWFANNLAIIDYVVAVMRYYGAWSA